MHRIGKVWYVDLFQVLTYSGKIDGSRWELMAWNRCRAEINRLYILLMLGCRFELAAFTDGIGCGYIRSGQEIPGINRCHILPFRFPDII
jgi:hypothetical protein